MLLFPTGVPTAWLEDAMLLVNTRSVLEMVGIGLQKANSRGGLMYNEVMTSSKHLQLTVVGC